MFRPGEFFDLSDPLAADLFADIEMVWQILDSLEELVGKLVGSGSGLRGEVMPGAYVSLENVYMAEGSRVEAGAYIRGPAYIGPGAIVRHGAYVRENVIMLEDSVLGHASEAKNSLFLRKAHAPHFNYVGDSILGSGTNLGAGTKLSNLAFTSAKDPETGLRPTIKITFDEELYDTGRAKLGAILGDNVQTGCNAVLNPGCLVGPNTLIYPNVNLRKGYYPGDQVIKLQQSLGAYPLKS